MTRLFIVAALLLSPLALPHAAAQDSTEPRLAPSASAITGVSLYATEARITREVEVTATEPVFDLAVGPLPPNLLEDTLQTDGDDHLRVLAVRIERRSGEDRASDEYKQLESQVEALAKQRKQLSRRRDSAADRFARFRRLEIGRPPADPSSAPKEEVHPLDWRAYLDMVRSGLERSLVSQIEVQDEIASLDRKIAAARSRMSEIHVPQRDVEMLAIVTVQNRTGTPGKLKLSYRMSAALWHPAYSFRIDPDQKRLELSLYGVVHQSTGEDWPAVPLEFSTSKPANGAAIPELLAQRITRQRYGPQPGMLAQEKVAKLDAMDLAAEMEYVEEEADSWEAPREEARTKYKSLDKKRAPARKARLAAEYTRNKKEYADDQRRPAARRAQAYEERLEKKSEDQRALFHGLNPHRVSPAESARGFIATFASIRDEAVPSDGAPHRLLITRLVLPYSEKRTAVPELSSHVYRTLLASLTGSDPMLAGPAAVFYGDSYLGLARLATTAPNEELEVNLGVDERMRLKRNIHDREEEYGVFSKATRYTTDVEIIVENYNKESVTVELSERIPFTAHEDIKVHLDRTKTDPPPGRFRAHAGIGEWLLTVPAGGSSELTVAYRIETPVDFQLTRWENPRRLEQDD